MELPEKDPVLQICLNFFFDTYKYVHNLTCNVELLTKTQDLQYFTYPSGEELKDLVGDWLKLLSVTFNPGLFNCFTSSRAKW